MNNLKNCILLLVDYIPNITV